MQNNLVAIFLNMQVCKEYRDTVFILKFYLHSFETMHKSQNNISKNLITISSIYGCPKKGIFPDSGYMLTSNY